MDIQGKVFIVTGGASGLGEGTARMLAERGGKVVIADMQTEKGEAVAKDIGGVFVRCDVSSEADGQAVVAQAVSMGKLMGLVNCAGIAPGIFGTPMLFGMPQEVQDALAAGVPFPSRLGTPQDYAKLAQHIFENEMLNGEVIRLDGAIRLAPR